jgi:hypothetical protein
MRNITQHTGTLRVVERDKNSGTNGNPRYVVTLDGYTCRTAIDSPLGYSITNYADKEVTASIGTHYGTVTIKDVTIKGAIKVAYIGVRFVNIDSWNRPEFKDALGNYYGSLDKLFPREEPEESVLLKVTAEDLTYFGSSFDCEPMGAKVANLRIVRRGEK